MATKNSSKKIANAVKSNKPAKKSKKTEATVVRLTPKLENYVVSEDVKTACGRPAIDNNDKVAADLRGKDLEAVYKAASKHLKVSVADLVAKYKHLNVGMQRMNLGNRMRKVLGVSTQPTKVTKITKEKKVRKAA